MPMRLTFLGGTGTVTGSKYMITSASKRILIDCGLFQGLKQLRLRNWDALPVDPKHVHAVVLTHAHIDHSGYLPLLVKKGFAGPVYCSSATRDLCEILLPDSGHLQEEDAQYANRRGFSKHRPALPLYTQQDAERCLSSLSSVRFDERVDFGDGLSFQLVPSGHILGSSFVILRHQQTSLMFSGDLGRPNDVLMRAPSSVAHADYLVLESTYGDRLHDPADPRTKLAEVINRTAKRGGTVVTPTFAVGRTQELLYYIHLLKKAQEIPDIPIFLNSPMATDATRIFHTHLGEHRLTREQCDEMCQTARIVTSVEESKALNDNPYPKVILAASGMATGGRVVHHLKAYAPDPRSTVLFAGFQAAGTRGAAMVAGAHEIKIHGQYFPVRAEIALLQSLSAHADYRETLGWLDNFEAAPRQAFITHGEPVAADALRHRIEEGKHWAVRVPDYLEEVKLT